MKKFFLPLSLIFSLIFGCSTLKDELSVSRAVVLFDGGSIEIDARKEDDAWKFRVDNSLDRDKKRPILAVWSNGVEIDPNSKEAENIILSLWIWLENKRRKNPKYSLETGVVIGFFQEICANPDRVAVSASTCEKFKIGE